MGRLMRLRELLILWVSSRRFAVASFAAILATCSPACCRAETFVSIGSGEMTAVYYSVAKAICEALFRELQAHGVWCSAESTPGSAYNIEHVVSGELEFGIVQSDVLYSAYKGIGRWEGKPRTELRSVLSVFPELVTVVARADADIHFLADLAGKRVAIGSLATGPRTTWDLISPDLPLATPPRLTILTQSETTSALCNGTIDASFFVVAHPSELISNRLAACPSNFVAIRGPVADKLISANPFYTKGLIPAQFYGVADFIPTIGTRATLVTSASAEPRIVAALARGIMAHVDELKTLHPALAGLKIEEMVTEGLTAPLHPAVEAVYKELGLIK
jgi:TRAP transporter TAXI family solute receptor